MKIFVAVDENNGILFNNRRVSKDKALRQRILDIVGDNTLYITEFSRKQFKDEIESGEFKIDIDEDMLFWADDEDYCFLEDVNADGFFDFISDIYLYRWNREYPADTYFSFPDEEYDLVSTEDFAGFSHDTITEEHFVRRQDEQEV